MNVLIVEDESRAARQLTQLLDECSFEYNLLATVDTVEDLVRWFKENEEPELIFMDVQLADGISFEVFKKVTINAPIIFTTAFDQYAIEAFKVNSIDYLLKPIKQSDLLRALTKFKKSSKPSMTTPDVLKGLLESMQASISRNSILVKSGNGFKQIKIADLDFLYSEDSLTFVVSKGSRYVLEETLDSTYATLDSKLFYKINRGQVINRDVVVKIEPYFNHRVKLALTNSRGLDFIVSRSKTTDFKKWLNS